MNLNDIVNRESPPEDRGNADKIPWDEPGFSRRMLREHLTQDHQAASRKFDKIDEHVRWLHEVVLEGKPSKVLDLGCGPGLYTSRLARLGHQCMGLDFSPASLEYSIHQAAEETLACEYAHADLLTADFGTGFDLVTMVNGELNTFIPETVASLFTRSRAALKDGGAVVLETTTDKTIRAMTAPPSWYTSERGLFSDDPHLILIENFRDEAQLMNTTRWFVTDTATGEVTRYTSATREYPPERLATMLQKSGFADIEHVPSLRGTPDPDQPAVFVTRARASS